MFKTCGWLDLNLGPHLLEATVQPTEPQPLLYIMTYNNQSIVLFHHRYPAVWPVKVAQKDFVCKMTDFDKFTKIA